MKSPVDTEQQQPLASLEHSSRPSKPRILLVPNLAWWVIGSMAKEVIKVGAGRFDFYLLTESLLAKRPDLARWLISRMSLVHALNETGVQPLLQFRRSETPPIVTWIHHITVWSADHQEAAVHSRMLTVCTEEWANRIREFCKEPPAICVVPHGVDSDFFHPVPMQRDAFGIPAGSFAVGFVASKDSDRDNNRKGVDTLLQVVARLRERLPNLHITFVGAGWEREAANLRTAGTSANAVNYLPKRRLPAFYSSIDTYLMTSRVEGGPCTVLESMACEVPVVATRVGLVPRVIVDGVNGYSTDCDDVDRLTEAVLCLAECESHRKRIGAEARRAIQESLRWQVTLPVLLDAYDAVAATRSAEATLLPRWFHQPERFVRAALASDALLWLWRRMRMGELSLTMALRRAPAMLEGLTYSDIIRAFGILTGTAFRVPNDSEGSRL